MKKILMATTALLSLSGVAMAADYNNSSVRTTPLTGFYVGGYGGYGWGDADTNVAGVDYSQDGADYGGFVGYKLDAFLDNTINRLGLGVNGALEGYYGWSDADDDSAGTSFEKNHEWGVTFRPGFSFLDNLTPLALNPYGIIGYRRAEFESSAAGVSDEDDYDGFELGIGTEFLAYGDFGVRVDYSHVWYGEENGIDPDEDDLRLGVAYHF